MLGNIRYLVHQEVVVLGARQERCPRVALEGVRLGIASSIVSRYKGGGVVGGG